MPHPSLPSTMRALVQTGVRQLEVMERPLPELAPHEILVQVRRCGICTFEQRIYTGSKDFPLPTITGHEASGVVAAVGPKARTSLQVGDRVALDLLDRCGECYYCRRGLGNHCVYGFGGKRQLGGFGQYVAIHPRQAFKLADGISLEEGTLAEPIADVVRSIHRGNGRAGDVALVIGCGLMGQVHLVVGRAWGLRVIAVDVNQRRLATARQLGAEAVYNPAQDNVAAAVNALTSGHGAPVVFLVAPGAQAAKLALEAVGIGGTVVIYTANYPPVELPIDLNLLHYKEITLTGTESRTAQEFAQGMELLNSGMLQLRPLLSAFYALEAADDAFQQALAGDSYRVILRVSE
ncbi:MAG: alcohol dehydrogenase catalytic domain-containing protein [Deinococcus sp.]|nr:alcohol dehydrogenase catalytic domain-containing protein [Deinococcus sp.]